jgi:hypothetical protein
MLGINYSISFLILKSIAMQKQIIGLLLVVAAATGVYFYFVNSRTCDKPPQSPTNQALIIGKWKTAAIEPAIDSAEGTYLYNFLNNGKMLRSTNDTTKADTIFYNWNQTAAAILMKLGEDSIEKEFVITKLNTDTLQWQTPTKVMVTLLKLSDK